jgi:nucleotide-binding universal stress UspA family protein
MKLMIAYDGSHFSEAALDDLPQSGLPARGTAHVICVSETWLPHFRNSQVGDDDIKSSLESKELNEARMLSEHARKRTQGMLPVWDVSVEAEFGSPATEILRAANKFGADLIVVGSQGHSAQWRSVLGSVSQKILAEARCSVRIGRGKIDVDGGPTRLAVAFDGSDGAQLAIDEIAKRRWPIGTSVHLITVVDPIVPAGIFRFVSPRRSPVYNLDVSEYDWVEKRALTAVDAVTKAGLEASFCIRQGNPKQTIVEEAQAQNADCIFLGASSSRPTLQQLVVGSTSAAVAARSHCSIEVVRPIELS